MTEAIQVSQMFEEVLDDRVLAIRTRAEQFAKAYYDICSEYDFCLGFSDQGEPALFCNITGSIFELSDIVLFDINESVVQ